MNWGDVALLVSEMYSGAGIIEVGTSEEVAVGVDALDVDVDTRVLIKAMVVMTSDTG